jgi:hypothetical protein
VNTVSKTMQHLVDTLVRTDYWPDGKIYALLSLYPRDVVFRAIWQAHVNYLIELVDKLRE